MIALCNKPFASISNLNPVRDGLNSLLQLVRIYGSIDYVVGVYRYLSTSAGDGSEEQVISIEHRAQIIQLFWKSFYNQLSNSISMDPKSPANMYHYEVIKLLINSKSLSQSDLSELQKHIEDLSMNFNEQSVFSSVPCLVQVLISKDKITAKEYLLQKTLSDTDLNNIKVFGRYTLEAILIYVLGLVFNPLQDLPVVKVSTLIQQIDSTVRVQAVILGGMNDKAGQSLSKAPKGKVSKSTYAIGASLVEFMIERNLVTLETGDIFTEVLPVSKNKGYVKSNCYALFNFDLRILPLKLNLPMVCKPLPWESKEDVASTLVDISGGYLSGLTGEIYNRFRLLTSRNYSNFYIKLHDTKLMCKVLTTLQDQVFEINKNVLSFIQENRDTLEQEGLLVNRFLARVNLQKASDLLRFSYFNNDERVKEVCRCDVLLKELFERVQRARYEDFVLILAEAYAGYKFYLPAFIDFRGRIYRAGMLHFHERDLARSLIVFASDAKAPEAELSQCEVMSLREQLESAAAFKYRNFESISQSYSWYQENRDLMIESDSSLIHLAKQASDPFQFLAKVHFNERVSDLEIIRGFNSVPVTQDASASAYQIMSYLLLNVEMARRTNLLPSPDNKIQDLYSCLKLELMDYLHSKFDSNKYAIIESRLTRKHVKLIFMPLIYGKTLISMVSDIRSIFGSLLHFNEINNLAKLCDTFWRSKYPDIVNLMRLINLIGWLCSVLDQPVQYSIPLFTTVQDYHKFNYEYIWVYNRLTHKRRQVTLQVPTVDRDTRKTLVATCVNFIHQKDAFIAMKVVEQLALKQAPVYTVHDNFITTAVSAPLVPQIYTRLFMEMGAPLGIINSFISLNLNLPINRSDEPIPGSELRTHLMSMVSQSDRSKLKKIEETVRCYELYVNTVCGGPPNYDEKWKSFNAHLDSWKSLGLNYSVHF